MHTKRMVVGISGASCAALGVLLLETMRQFADWETHLVVSEGGRITLAHETRYSLAEVEALATMAYHPKDIGAAPASGTFRTQGMVIVPCSMKSLAAVACGYCDTLLQRAADVTLKERRKLVLVTREMPLHAVHLNNMLSVTHMGGVIMPPVLSLYNQPAGIEAMLQHIVAKILQQFGLDMPGGKEWLGLPTPP